MERYSESLKCYMPIEDMNVYHLINALKKELNSMTVGEVLENSELIETMFTTIICKIEKLKEEIEKLKEDDDERE